MKKIILLFFVVLSVQIFSQAENFRRSKSGADQFQKFIFTQIFVVPLDSVAAVYYLYKIPFQNLVFVKNGNNYKSEIRLALEVKDSNSDFVKREIKDWKIQAASFDETNSENLFAEGFIKLDLSEGSYNILPILTDQNSNREIKIEPEQLDIFPESNSKNIKPLIVGNNKINCNGDDFFQVINFEDNVPFANGNYDFIIPVSDTSLKELNVAVLSQSDTVAKSVLKNSFTGSFVLKECSGRIIVTNDKNNSVRNFILSGISSKLKEGTFSIIINNDTSSSFTGEVLWYNKPASLKNHELAIKALKYTADKKVIDSLLDLKEINYYKGLTDYWKTMDPTPETEFNELMAEYYSRVDHAQLNFSSLTGVKGVDTDRGKIFVKFGKPDQVERSSNERGKVVETWIYIKPHRKFIFVDKQGVGEFSLESS